MNLWKSFDRLMQTGGPLYIGEVTAVNTGFSDQRCTVTVLPGGAEIEVTGTGRALAIGQRWIIRDGRIVEEAPAGGTVLTVTV